MLQLLAACDGQLGHSIPSLATVARGGRWLSTLRHERRVAAQANFGLSQREQQLKDALKDDEPQAVKLHRLCNDVAGLKGDMQMVLALLKGEPPPVQPTDTNSPRRARPSGQLARAQSGLPNLPTQPSRRPAAAVPAGVTRPSASAPLVAAVSASPGNGADPHERVSVTVPDG